MPFHLEVGYIIILIMLVCSPRKQGGGLVLLLGLTYITKEMCDPKIDFVLLEPHIIFYSSTNENHKFEVYFHCALKVEYFYWIDNKENINNLNWLLPFLFTQIRTVVVKTILV